MLYLKARAVFLLCIKLASSHHSTQQVANMTCEDCVQQTFQPDQQVPVVPASVWKGLFVAIPIMLQPLEQEGLGQGKTPAV